jgi:hypothetical protein
MSKLAIVAVVTTLAWSGCGTDYTIAEQNLSGSIGGVDWTFATGETNAFLSEDGDYFAVLYAESFSTCASSSPMSVDHLIISIPKEIGEWGLSLSRNMTFVVQEGDGPNNLIGTEGTLRVDSLTTDTLVGGIYAEFDGDNVVDGTFTVAICPD